MSDLSIPGSKSHYKHNPYWFMGFNTQNASIYGFTVDHFIVLNWIRTFYPNATPHPTRPQFRWMSYQKFKEDCKFISMSDNKLGYIVAQLCGEHKSCNPDLVYPLDKIVEQQPFGKAVYFNLNHKGMGYFMEDSAFLGTPEDATDEVPEENSGNEVPEEQETRRRVSRFDESGFTTTHQKTKNEPDISPVVREILTGTKETPYSEADEKLIDGETFSHNINPVGTKTSKTLQDIQAMLEALVSGTFEDRFPIDSGSRKRINTDWFSEFTQGWDTCRDLLFTAKHQYQEYQKQNPARVHSKSLKEFIYNPVNKNSPLLTTLSGSQGRRGALAAAYREKMDSQSVSILQGFKLTRVSWNEFKFWKSMFSVWEHFTQNWKALIKHNRDSSYYIGKRTVSTMIQNYVNFLETKKNLDPNYLYYGSHVWQEFVKNFYQEMDCDLDLPESEKVSA